MEDAATRLKGIAADVTACRRCPELLTGRRRAVPGGGHPHAHFMIVAAQPSEDDEASDRPGGTSLTDELAELFPHPGRPEERNVYVTSLVKCVPRSQGHRREPLDAERGNCFAFLSAEISTITPHFLLPVGRDTVAFILQRLFGHVIAGALPPAVRVLESPAFRVVPLASPVEMAALPDDERRHYMEQLRSLAGKIGM